MADPNQQHYDDGANGGHQQHPYYDDQQHQGYDSRDHDPHQQGGEYHLDPQYNNIQRQDEYHHDPQLFNQQGSYVGGGGSGGLYDPASVEYHHSGGGRPEQEMQYNAAGVDDGNYQYDPQQEPGFGNSNEGTEYSSIPDIMALNHYCATAHAPRDNSEEAAQQADLSWEPVREWLRTHSAEEVSAAAQQRGDQAMTALHFACRNAPPIDVVDVLLSIAAETAQWQDGFGWLPIHYACACGTETKVVKKLAEAYPESKTTVDRRGRTPLHFALGNSNPDNPVSPEVVILLSSTRAAEYADDSGMLPLRKFKKKQNVQFLFNRPKAFILFASMCKRE